MKMKNINPKDVSKNYSEERCIFLEGELKKIEAQIKTVEGYSKEDIKYQKELWVLRDNIIQEIGKIPDNLNFIIEKHYDGIENKAENNKNITSI
jgi:hypothetical protein